MSSLWEADTRALVAAAQVGDRQAIDELMRQLRPRIFRFVLSRVLDPYLADDLTQEVTMTVLRALPRYVDRGLPFVGWVFGIATNKVSEWRRADSRRPETATDALPDHRSRDPDSDPAAASEHLDRSRQVATLLASLPAPQGEILRLRIAAGLSAEETATALGMTPGAVRVAQHRALHRLRTGDVAEALR